MEIIWKFGNNLEICSQKFRNNNYKMKSIINNIVKNIIFKMKIFAIFLRFFCDNGNSPKMGMITKNIFLRLIARRLTM